MGNESSESQSGSTTPPQHTPGPWHFNAWRGEVLAAEGFIVAETVTLSNGDLIAVAPDLLAALRDIVAEVDVTPLDVADLERLIAKAVGRQQ